MPLGRKILYRAALRSFFLQAVWNFERMQNLGWAYCMQPVIQKLYPEPKARAEAYKRHLEFFNTHPYLAGIILGYAARVEVKAAQGDAVAIQAASSVKLGMMGPLAALGDSFFWATLRPMAALVGVMVVLFAQGSAWASLGAGAFLVIYNMPHLFLRVLAVPFGYAAGEEVVTLLRRIEVPALVQRIQALALVVLGALLGGLDSFGKVLSPGSAAWPLHKGAVLIGFGVGAFLLLRKKVPASRLLWLAFVGSVLGSYLHPSSFWGTP
jgi:PTS system mannose-specific IID component